MKVSVIIPIYKVEKYLRRCVDSVLNQTYHNIEVILVDDGSPDNCPAICDDYAKKDVRVVVIHKRNGGLSEARNFGVEKATGEYGMFLDSDDFWDNANAVQSLVERLNETKADVLNFAYYKCYENTGKIIRFAPNEVSMPVNISDKVDKLRYLIEHNLISASACNKIIRIDILRKLPFEVGKLSEDIEWTAKLICEDALFDYVSECFYCYLQRGGSISQSISDKSCENLAEAIIGCCRIAEAVNPVIKEYVCTYTAYQYSTFIAVQALTRDQQYNQIQQLKPYYGILRYYGSNTKIKYMYYGTKLFGFTLWCRLIRWTRRIWNSRRERI